MKRYELSDEERAGIVREIQENWRPHDPREYPSMVANFCKTSTGEVQADAVSYFANECRDNPIARDGLNLLAVDCLTERRAMPKPLVDWLIEKLSGQLPKLKRRRKCETAVRNFFLVSAVAELVDVSQETNHEFDCGVLRATRNRHNPIDEYTACGIVGKVFNLSYDRVEKIWNQHEGIITRDGVLMRRVRTSQT